MNILWQKSDKIKHVILLSLVPDFSATLFIRFRKNTKSPIILHDCTLFLAMLHLEKEPETKMF